MSNDYEKVKQVVMQICGSDTLVNRADFDPASFVIQPCDYEQFSLICEKLKGSGQYIKPLNPRKGAGCICNIGQY